MNKNLMIWCSLKQQQQSLDQFGTIVKDIGVLLGQGEAFQIQKFKEGISDDYIKAKMMTYTTDQLEKAISKAKRYEIKKRYEPRLEGSLNTISNYTQRNQQNRRNQNNRGRRRNTDLSNIKCYSCNQFGHYARNCNNNNQQNQTNQQNRQNPQNQRNHHSQNPNPQQNSLEINALNLDDSEKTQRMLQQIDLKINGKCFCPLLDTGAQLEVIRLDLFKLLNKNYNPINARAAGISGE